MNNRDFKQILQEELRNVTTKDDLREIVREETKNFAIKDDLNS